MGGVIKLNDELIWYNYGEYLKECIGSVIGDQKNYSLPFGAERLDLDSRETSL